MRILTPNANYFLDIHEDIPQEDLKDSVKVVKETWVENVYQIHESDFNYPETLAHQPTFVDIGANIGAVSLYVASFNDNRDANSQIRVIAVEPQSNNLRTLSSNIKVNDKVRQIKIVDKAIYPIDLVSISNRGGNSKLDVGGEAVSAITLDQLFTDYDIEECDVLKMDIEGAEYKVLLAASDETLRKIKYLTLEFDATDPSTFGALAARLAELFNLHVIGRVSGGGYIYGRRY